MAPLDGAGLSEGVYGDMGPTLLAEQPLTPPGDPKKDLADWWTVYAHLESSLQSLRTWRWSWWAHWGALAQYFKPRRYKWVITGNRMSRGNEINNAIVDSTGTLSLQTCASGMWSGLTNPSRPWIKLQSALPWVQLEADGKAWLEDTTERLYAVLAQSNFYAQMAVVFEDLALFGTSPMIIYEDQQDVIRCYVPCAGEYYLRAGARLDTDTLYREFTFTVLQIVDMFHIENCPPQIISAWNEGGAALDMEFVVAHAIEPNFAINGRGARIKDTVRIVPSSFAYREVYWLKSQKTPAPLSVRGFNGRPFMALLWSREGNDPYGRSPGMDALGDTQQIQIETRRKAEFIEKLVKPPMGADPSMKNEPSSIIPGMITYVSTDNGKKGFWPLMEMQAQALAPLIADIEKVEGRIERCFFVDVFMAISRMEGVQPRNQLELTKRDLERLQKLGPVIDLAKSQLEIGITRVLEIMERRRILKPKPDSLRNIPLKFDIVDLMRLAQRASEGVGMKDTLAVAGSLSAAAKAAGVPDPIRVLNLDKSLQRLADINGFPSDCLFTDDEVKANDQAAQQGKQQAELPGQAMAGVNAAKILSQTALPDGNSALGALINGGPA